MVLSLISIHLWTLRDRPICQVVQVSLAPSLPTTQHGSAHKIVFKLEQ